MAIELLTVCTWGKRGSGYKRAETKTPSWDQVEAAIRSLDAQSCTELFLNPQSSNLETYLSVAGGSGRYIVTGSIDNESFPTVLNGSGDKRRIDELLMVGGQGCDFPRDMIVDIDTALIAARSFLDSGEFGGGGLLWEDV